MRGNGIICLKVDQHSYHEHGGLANAKAEAIRLACSLNSDIVVYVPVLRVSPPKSLAVDVVTDHGLRLPDLEQEDLPF